MGDVISSKRGLAPTPWVLCTIEGGNYGYGCGFNVYALTGPPTHVATQREHLGALQTLAEAVSFARGQCGRLGITKIVDLTSRTTDRSLASIMDKQFYPPRPNDDGGAA